MAEDEVQALWDAAKAAYDRKDYEAELILRRQLCARFPKDMNCLHNLGLCLLNQGQLDEAISKFEEVLTLDSSVGRAYNNLATAFMRKGVELQHLTGIFHLALLFSESYDDLVRHYINLCISAAIGKDHGNQEALDLIAESIRDVVDKCSGEPAIKAEQLEQLLELLNAHRPLAEYRESFAAKKWSAAKRSLSESRAAFERIGFAHRVSLIDSRLSPVLHVSESLFGLLEAIALGRLITPALALDACEACRSEAVEIRDLVGESGVHLAFLDAIGWFLTKLRPLLLALSSDGSLDSSDEVPSEIVGWLTAHSFTGIGADLLSLLNAVNRQRGAFFHECETIAAEDARELMRQRVWLQVGLQCSSLALDFRNVSHDIARSLLGWTSDSLEQYRRVLDGFRRFVERQAASEIYCGGNPRESIGRTLLQAFLTARSYREVPVRGGQCDLLAFDTDGKRTVVETKIWRGPQYHEQGLRELCEYLEGEADDDGLLGAFYVVFDPTATCSAASHVGGKAVTVTAGRFVVDIVVIHVALPVPSRSRS